MFAVQEHRSVGDASTQRSVGSLMRGQLLFGIAHDVMRIVVLRNQKATDAPLPSATVVKSQRTLAVATSLPKTKARWLLIVLSFYLGGVSSLPGAFSFLDKNEIRSYLTKKQKKLY